MSISDIEQVKRDVVIIGGGPAGMAVAVKLTDLGITDILLIEKEDRMGGVLSQCIHDGFGLIKLGKSITGPEYAQIYKEKVVNRGIDVLLCSTAMEVINAAAENKKIVKVATSHGETQIEAKAIVLTTGCRERGRGNLGISGSRPAGIYTAGTAQAFINLKNLMPGRRIVILGSGDIGLIMARRFTLEGAEVVCVVEKEDTYGGLKRNVKQCLEDFDIPLLTNTIISNIYGKNRVEGVDIGECDSQGKLIGKTQYIACDTIIISAGLIPEDGILNCDGKGVFICGNAAYVHGLVDDVSKDGEEVACEIKEYLNGHSEILINSKYSFDNITETRKQRVIELCEKKKTENANKLRNTLTCILCPNSCEIDEQFEGGKCPKGKEYAKEEFTLPTRVLTTSVKISGDESRLLSVRTTKAIPKSRLMEAMAEVRKISVLAPIRCGQVIEKDFLIDGVNLIATGEVLL